MGLEPTTAWTTPHPATEPGGVEAEIRL